MLDPVREEALQWLNQNILGRLFRVDQDKVADLIGMSTGELLGGMPGTCPGCPFNDGATEEASIASNYGCLPGPADIYKMKHESGHNWACHEDETRVCAGLCHRAKPEGLDLRSGGLIKYSTWSHEGEEAALKEAGK